MAVRPGRSQVRASNPYTCLSNRVTRRQVPYKPVQFGISVFKAYAGLMPWGLGLRGTAVVPYNINDEKSVTTHGLSATCPVGSVLTPIRCCAACSESRNLRQAQRLQHEESRFLSHMMLSSISIVIVSSLQSVHSYLGQHSKLLRLNTIALRFLMDAASRQH